MKRWIQWRNESRARRDARRVINQQDTNTVLYYLLRGRR